MSSKQKWLSLQARVRTSLEQTIPDPIRENMLDEVRNEFERISKILRDEGNPLESLKVITNNQDAKPFFEALMRQYRIPGQVVVK